MRPAIIVPALVAFAAAALRPQKTEFEIVNKVADSQKRDNSDLGSSLSRRDIACEKQPAGVPAYTVSSPADDSTSFLAYQPFVDIANNQALPANVPQGYSLAFQNLQASSSVANYLGYKTLTSYNPIQCASYCDQQDGCIAFNLYFERDPTVNPNNASCLNPPSLTNIKCVRWGTTLDSKGAVNTGETRGDFEVVIAGSNGYNKNPPPSSQPGFTGPYQLGGAINAPLDPQTKTNTYMGYKFFAFGDQYQNLTQGAAACTVACIAQTAYNSRHPPSTGKPAVCNQVNIYVLSDENQPQGMYCSMYTETWSPFYATNYGQYRGSDFWSVSQSYSYDLATYGFGEICAIGGCPTGSYTGGSCGGYGQSTTGTC